MPDDVLGDEWRDLTTEVLGRPIAAGYQVNRRGDVRSRRRSGGPGGGGLSSRYRRIKGRINRDGYRVIQLSDGVRAGKLWFVHLLVARAFIGPPAPGQEMRHLDGNPTNNHVANLAWGTHVENMADMDRHGRLRRGNKTPHARLDPDSARDLVRRWKGGATLADLATRFGISDVAAGRVVRGETWGHATGLSRNHPEAANAATKAARTVRGSAKHNALITEADAVAIVRLHRDGLSIRGLGRRFGISYVTARRIVRGEKWTSATASVR